MPNSPDHSRKCPEELQRFNARHLLYASFTDIDRLNPTSQRREETQSLFEISRSAVEKLCGLKGNWEFPIINLATFVIKSLHTDLLTRTLTHQPDENLIKDAVRTVYLIGRDCGEEALNFIPQIRVTLIREDVIPLRPTSTETQINFIDNKIRDIITAAARDKAVVTKQAERRVIRKDIFDTINGIDGLESL